MESEYVTYLQKELCKAQERVRQLEAERVVYGYCLDSALAINERLSREAQQLTEQLIETRKSVVQILAINNRIQNI